MTTAKTTTRMLLPLVLCCLVQLYTIAPARAQCQATESAALAAPEGTGWHSYGAYFGCAVATDGTIVIAGAQFDGQDGGQAGAAYVHRWDGTTWVQETKLRPADGGENARFGASLAMDDDTVVIGSGLGLPEGLGGAAYVFRNYPAGSATWVQEAKLVASDSSHWDSFSNAISIHNHLLAVGGQFKDEPSEECGSAYIFRRDDNGTPANPTDDTWAQEAKLVPADLAAGDRFGCSVAVWGDFAMAGAHYDDDLGDESGSAYVFRWTGSNWVQHQKLTASDGQQDDYFGIGVALSENWAMVGAVCDDDAGPEAGAVYAFQRDDNGTPGNTADDTWVERAKLYASDPVLYGWLGENIAISDDLAVISGSGENMSEPQCAYIFRYDPQSPSYWVQQAKLLSREGYMSIYYTPVVALVGDLAVMGIPDHYLEQEETRTGRAFVYRGLRTDCNANDTIDLCDIADGTSEDQNTNGLPDECEPGIATLSTWGLLALTILMVSAGVIIITRRRVQPRDKANATAPGWHGPRSRGHAQ